jgi:hypothetical protein
MRFIHVIVVAALTTVLVGACSDGASISDRPKHPAESAQIQPSTAAGSVSVSGASASPSPAIVASSDVASSPDASPASTAVCGTPVALADYAACITARLAALKTGLDQTSAAWGPSARSQAESLQPTLTKLNGRNPASTVDVVLACADVAVLNSGASRVNFAIGTGSDQTSVDARLKVEALREAVQSTYAFLGCASR